MTPIATFWVVVVAVATFFGSIALAAWLLVRLPATYFLAGHRQGWREDRHPVLRWIFVILKNLLGAILVVIGVVMLFTPGQGVLTILIGIMLLDFPGKRALERKLVNRPGVKRGINRLRERFGRDPLVMDE